MSSTFIGVKVFKKSEKLAPVSDQDSNNLRWFVLICDEKLSRMKKEK